MRNTIVFWLLLGHYVCHDIGIGPGKATNKKGTNKNTNKNTNKKGNWFDDDAVEDVSD